MRPAGLLRRRRLGFKDLPIEPAATATTTNVPCSAPVIIRYAVGEERIALNSALSTFVADGDLDGFDLAEL